MRPLPPPCWGESAGGRGIGVADFRHQIVKRGRGPIDGVEGGEKGIEERRREGALGGDAEEGGPSVDVRPNGRGPQPRGGAPGFGVREGAHKVDRLGAPTAACFHRDNHQPAPPVLGKLRVGGGALSGSGALEGIAGDRGGVMAGFAVTPDRAGQGSVNCQLGTVPIIIKLHSFVYYIFFWEYHQKSLKLHLGFYIGLCDLCEKWIKQTFHGRFLAWGRHGTRIGLRN